MVVDGAIGVELLDTGVLVQEELAVIYQRPFVVIAIDLLLLSCPLFRGICFLFVAPRLNAAIGLLHFCR